METDAGPKFEDILDVIGDMGPAQILIIVFSIALDATAGLSTNYYIIESGNPGYFCTPVDRNTSDVSGNATWNGCPTAKTDCVNVTLFEGYTSPTTEWQFICQSRYMSRLLPTLMFAGNLLGIIASGQIGDQFGRRPVLLASWILNIATTSILSVAPSWPVYAFIRIINGITSGCCSSVAGTLAVEYVGPKWRVFVGLRLGWRVAHFGIAFFAYFIRQWRHLVLALSLTWIPFFVLACFFLPESSRWLFHKKRYEDAHKCLTFIAKLNRKPPPDADLVRRVEEEFRVKEAVNSKYSYHDLFRTRYYAKITLVSMFAWLTSACIAYGIKTEIPNMTGSLYQNLLIAASVDCVTRLLAPFVLNVLGRRWSYPVFTAVPVLSMFIILALDLTDYMEGREGIRTGLALTSYGSIAGVWLLLFVYCCEVYPTVIRNIGMSAMSFMCVLGGIISPQIGLLSDFHVSLPYVVLGVLGVLTSVVMVAFMPETKGKPLPEELPPRRVVEEGKVKEKDETYRMDVTSL
ncbi:solute carrier family 22 member 15-like isoform X1 [Lineus longissimus]|uniref:solute carrier family 22 member 15-like isoform X1 n=1 Tax=Lineus longissimus TaxID=88925 RepID=UPI002B4FA31C